MFVQVQHIELIVRGFHLQPIVPEQVLVISGGQLVPPSLKLINLT